MFKVVNGLQKVARYFYIALIVSAIYATASGYITGVESWVSPAQKVVTAIELFFIVLYFGIKICKQVFVNIDGKLLGTDVKSMVLYWEWLEDKIRDILVYNGALACIIISFYM